MIIVYFFEIREKFFLTLVKFIKFRKIYLMINKNFNRFEHKENVNFIKGHSFDYSNSLLKKDNFKKTNLN